MIVSQPSGAGLTTLSSISGLRGYIDPEKESLGSIKGGKMYWDGSNCKTVEEAEIHFNKRIEQLEWKIEGLTTALRIFAEACADR